MEFTKKQLTNEIARRTKFTRADVEEIFEIYLDVLEDIVRARNSLSIKGYYSVKPRLVRTHMRHHLYKGFCELPEHYELRLKAGGLLKKAVRDGK